MTNFVSVNQVSDTMRKVVVLLFILAFVGQTQALPDGIGSVGDNGCACHGGSDDSTNVTLSGLPEIYNASEEYELTLTLESPVEQNDVKGGFRILISQGVLTGEVQEIDGGYTHNSSLNKQRSWTINWTAPQQDDKLATFVIHGNAVNGNGQPTGDEWHSLSLAVAGPNYTGDVNAPDLGDTTGKITNRQFAVAGVGLLAILTLAFFVIKD